MMMVMKRKAIILHRPLSPIPRILGSPWWLKMAMEMAVNEAQRVFFCPTFSLGSLILKWLPIISRDLGDKRPMIYDLPVLCLLTGHWRGWCHFPQFPGGARSPEITTACPSTQETRNFLASFLPSFLWGMLTLDLTSLGLTILRPAFVHLVLMFGPCWVLPEG